MKNKYKITLLVVLIALSFLAFKNPFNPNWNKIAHTTIVCLWLAIAHITGFAMVYTKKFLSFSEKDKNFNLSTSGILFALIVLFVFGALFLFIFFENPWLKFIIPVIMIIYSFLTGITMLKFSHYKLQKITLVTFWVSPTLSIISYALTDAIKFEYEAQIIICSVLWIGILSLFYSYYLGYETDEEIEKIKSTMEKPPA